MTNDSTPMTYQNMHQYLFDKLNEWDQDGFNRCGQQGFLGEFRAAQHQDTWLAMPTPTVVENLDRVERWTPLEPANKKTKTHHEELYKGVEKIMDTEINKKKASVQNDIEALKLQVAALQQQVAIIPALQQQVANLESKVAEQEEIMARIKMDASTLRRTATNLENLLEGRPAPRIIMAGNQATSNTSGSRD